MIFHNMHNEGNVDHISTETISKVYKATSSSIVANPYFAIIVEVGVEPDPALARGLEVDQHGSLGVIHWEEHIKLKAAVSIWSIGRPGNQNLKYNNIPIKCILLLPLPTGTQYNSLTSDFTVECQVKSLSCQDKMSGQNVVIH